MSRPDGAPSDHLTQRQTAAPNPQKALAAPTRMPNSPRSALKSASRRSTGCQPGTGCSGTRGAPCASSSRTPHSASQRREVMPCGANLSGKGPRRRGKASCQGVHADASASADQRAQQVGTAGPGAGHQSVSHGPTALALLCCRQRPPGCFPAQQRCQRGRRLGGRPVGGTGNLVLAHGRNAVKQRLPTLGSRRGQPFGQPGRVPVHLPHKRGCLAGLALARGCCRAARRAARTSPHASKQPAQATQGRLRLALDPLAHTLVAQPKQAAGGGRRGEAARCPCRRHGFALGLLAAWTGVGQRLWWQPHTTAHLVPAGMVVIVIILAQPCFESPM